MKKCSKCGAIQNDDRTTCLDCGALLGKPLSEEEEGVVEEQLDDQLYAMSERAQDFYVSVPDKILGILCIVIAIASLVLLNMVSVAKANLEKQNPDPNRFITTSYIGDTLVNVVGFDMSTGESFEPSAEELERLKWQGIQWERLESAAYASLVALVSALAAFPSFLFPRFVWTLDTLKYRLWVDADPTPSFFYIITMKFFKYVFFVIAAVGIAYAYFVYLT